MSKRLGNQTPTKSIVLPYKKSRYEDAIELAETGGRVEFRTRTSTGGPGEGFDLLLINEAQEYTTDQESALKYAKRATHLL